MAKDGCTFCKIVTREIPAKIVFEDNKVMAFEDVKPQAPVHIVIIPKHHMERLSDLKDEDARLLGSLVLTAKKVAREKGIQGSGYRVVINCNKDAGQAVLHVHLHLLGGRPMAWPPG